MSESRDRARELFYAWFKAETGSDSTIDLVERAWLDGFRSAREADTMAAREAQR